MNRASSFVLTQPLNATDHSMGPEEARITVIEYGDFECPNCKQAYPAVKLLLRRFKDRIRFAYRHFPLEEVHPHALGAAEAAEAAADQRRFWAMHDLLFENQSHLKAHHVRDYAERLGLDVPRFVGELEDHVHLQRIRGHIQSGRDSGVRATPTFFVNQRIQDVSFGLTSLFETVEAALRN